MKVLTYLIIFLIQLNYINSITTKNNFKKLFSKYYLGGEKKLYSDILKRLKWTYLDYLETCSQFPYKWFNYSQFYALGPVIQCPNELFHIYGQGDGEKRICGKIDEDCVVVSLGSNNQWDFELDFIKKNPHCKVHTFDCFNPGIVPNEINQSATSYKICVGPRDEIIQGREFMTWKSILSKAGINHPPTALKMDIEGFEYSILREMMKTSPHLLPYSISFELHSRSSERGVPWSQRNRNAGEIALFIDYLMRFGYMLVDRHDNIFCQSCSEIVVARIGEYSLHHESHHHLQRKYS